jgi:hypothetical protein
MQSSPPGTILREPKIQELYDAVTALKPKLGRSLSTVVGTYGLLSLAPISNASRNLGGHACKAQYRCEIF